MGKWMALIGILAAVFLYDPPWAIQQVDHWVRVARMW
jgi:hypothetical protein